ncbi:MAG: hypothetical protein C4583_01185 [Anaerolineaceae bacterium]|nr:MAG: hypothetical protein C4583_01185 [Anaerolineaceae bacterium]
MENIEMQEVLNAIRAELTSNDPARQADAIHRLGTVNFTSEAVVSELERLALHAQGEVQSLALAALKLASSQYVKAQKADLPRFTRELILKEVDKWETNGYVESVQAEVIRRQYDFDFGPAAPKAIEPAAVSASVPAPRAPAAPTVPRPSLAQTIFSETSVKIYLYLGAFFVIAAAAIWAVVRPEARLPVLMAATLAFAAGAVFIKKRLPLPSFVLFIVFSFLLPIDANVIADSLNLSAQGNEAYWTVVFVLMAVLWALGTWFYSSRLFSVAAFFSLSLAVLRFGEIFDAPTDWNVFSMSISVLLGLFGVRLLQAWKDRKFALPLFLLAQFFQFVLLFVSLFSVIENNWIGSPPSDWTASALTWILAASFYVASDILVPFVLFPWLAAASLFLVPWLALSALDAPTRVQIAGYAVWGALAALASEFVYRRARPAWIKYHFPLLALSLALFFISIVWALLEKIEYGFAAFLATGIVYTVLHISRPRWYVWMTALLAGLGAYFTFYALPFMQNTDVYFGYKLLGASLFLLIPELFFKEPLTFARAWNWPPVALGVLLTFFNLLTASLVPVANESQFGNTAVILGTYTLLFTGYALRFKQPILGYFAAASAALTVVYTLQHFERDWWLPALTALAVVYYAAGFFLARREETKPWGAMLVISGLALGGLVSALALTARKETGGWYALVIAALFLVEMFTRKNGWLEIFAESILSIALILILNDFNVCEISPYIFGLSLLWLVCDAVFKLTFQSRKLEFAAKIIGGALTVAAAVFLTAELASRVSVIYFGIYAVFFAIYAWLNKNPLIGYVSTFFLALTVYFGLEAANINEWIFPQIALATVYYAAGFTLRRADKTKGWDSMLLFSGLGLGTFVALLAPSQMGGLEKSIPIAIAATFYAAEAFARKNIWLGFPANGLYLMSYFVILGELKVDEPQFFSVGAAALGLLQHYLLRRAEQKTAAFFMGMVSQLVLLGTSYIQMINTGELKYFFLLLFQFLAMLAYGIVVRSRSLIITPIAIVVMATLTILYNALKDLQLVFIIGITGLILLALGILAVVMRERITNLAERFNDWDA